MIDRIEHQEAYRLQPVLSQSLRGLKAAAEKSLEPALIHLIELRASQLNGCAFCLNLHSREAFAHGESQQRLNLLAAWREAPCFSERERLALDLCEALTRMEQEPVSDERYQRLARLFSAREIVDLLGIIVSINAWNRVVATLRFPLQQED